MLSYDKSKMTYTFFVIESDYNYNLPYIISYYTQYYSITYVYIYIKKTTITKDRLIGICSVAAASFFIILYVIVKLVRRKQYTKLPRTKEYWFVSDEEDEQLEKVEIVYKGEILSNCEDIYPKEQSEQSDQNSIDELIAFWL